jgi:protease I
MRGRLHGKVVAILAADGVNQLEVAVPRETLEAEGAAALLVSPVKRLFTMSHVRRGARVDAELKLDEAEPRAFDALIVPGGALSVDTLRVDPAAIAFVRAFAVQGKPIAAIGHGAWMLVDAGLARGRTMTSCPSIRTDLENAGAHWVDAEVVIDDLAVTSRGRDDLRAFVRQTIAIIGACRGAEGPPEHRLVS